MNARRCCFRYNEATSILPLPIVFKFHNVALYETELYSDLLYEIPKCIREDKNIDDYGFDGLLEEWSYYKLKNQLRQNLDTHVIPTKSCLKRADKKGRLLE